MFTWRSRCLEAVCSLPAVADETDQELAQEWYCRRYLSAAGPHTRWDHSSRIRFLCFISKSNKKPSCR